MTLPEARDTYGTYVGICVAGLLAVIYLPLTIQLRDVLDLPKPDPTPWSPRAHPDGFTPRYWAIWLVSWLILLTPGVVLITHRSSRRTGIAYTITAAAIATPLALIAAYIEYTPWFGPT